MRTYEYEDQVLDAARFVREVYQRIADRRAADQCGDDPVIGSLNPDRPAAPCN